MKTKLIPLTFAVGMMAMSSASAALTLTIDTTNKTFNFTGSDTGTTPRSFEQWSYQSLSGNTSTYNNEGSSTGLSSSPALTADNVWEACFTLGSDTYTFMQLNWADSGTKTITGSGVSESYASFAAPEKVCFEAAIGHVMTSSGGGFSAISVVAVPEPSSFVLLGLGGLALGLRRRRA